MNNLTLEILKALEKDGGWMATGAIFNRVEGARHKQQVVDGLEELEKQRKVQSTATTLGILFALPTVPAPHDAAAPSAVQSISNGGLPPAIKDLTQAAVLAAAAGITPHKSAVSTPEEIADAMGSIKRVLTGSGRKTVEDLARETIYPRETIKIALSRLQDTHTVERVSTPGGAVFQAATEDIGLNRTSLLDQVEIKPLEVRPSESEPIAPKPLPPKADTLQERVVNAVRAAGAQGLTPSETHAAVGGHAGSVYTTLSVMVRKGVLARTGPGGRYMAAGVAPAITEAPAAPISQPPADQPVASEANSTDAVDDVAPPVPEFLHEPVSDAAKAFMQAPVATPGEALKPPRFAFWSDGTFVIERAGGEPIQLDATESQALLDYVSSIRLGLPLPRAAQ